MCYDRTSGSLLQASNTAILSTLNAGRTVVMVQAPRGSRGMGRWSSLEMIPSTMCEFCPMTRPSAWLKMLLIAMVHQKIHGPDCLNLNIFTASQCFCACQFCNLSLVLHRSSSCLGNGPRFDAVERGLFLQVEIEDQVWI